MKGQRRVGSFLITILGIFLVEWQTNSAGLGLSVNCAGAITAATATYFGSVAVDKHARAANGGGE